MLLILAVCILGLLVKIIDYADAGVSTVQGNGQTEYLKIFTKGSGFTLTDLLMTGVPY